MSKVEFTPIKIVSEAEAMKEVISAAADYQQTGKLSLTALCVRGVESPVDYMHRAMNAGIGQIEGSNLRPQRKNFNNYDLGPHTDKPIAFTALPLTATTLIHGAAAIGVLSYPWIKSIRQSHRTEAGYRLLLEDELPSNLTGYTTAERHDMEVGDVVIFNDSLVHCVATTACDLKKRGRLSTSCYASAEQPEKTLMAR